MTLVAIAIHSHAPLSDKKNLRHRGVVSPVLRVRVSRLRPAGREVTARMVAVVVFPVLLGRSPKPYGKTAIPSHPASVSATLPYFYYACCLFLPSSIFTEISTHIRRPDTK